MLSQSLGSLPKAPKRSNKYHSNTDFRGREARLKGSFSNSSDEKVDISFSSDEDVKTNSVLNPLRGKAYNSILIPASSGVNKTNPKSLSRSLINPRGVSQEKFSAVKTSHAQSPYRNRTQAGADTKQRGSEPKQWAMKAADKQALNDFVKELSDDLIKCKNCQKDIPIFFQEGHAAIC